MRITCTHVFKGQPELDAATTLWAFIASADKLTCVVDGDAVQVAAVRGIDEIPLAEVGLGLWHKRGVLGEVLASHAARSGEQYRNRLKVFAGKSIEWMGDVDAGETHSPVADRFPAGAHVYFGRGPMEFIGTVESVTETGEVVVLGVETGCLHKEFERARIASIEHLRVLDAAEWTAQIKYEPAFAQH